MRRAPGVDYPTLIDLFVGDDPQSGPDPNLTEITEAEAPRARCELQGEALKEALASGIRPVR
jgi:hypothetical protein